MELQHFSHEHPLILKEILEQKNDDSDGVLCFCSWCQEQVLGPSYSCNRVSCSNCKQPVGAQRNRYCNECGIDFLGDGGGGKEYCNFSLHKSCAELPTEMNNHPMHPNHTLHLLKPHRGKIYCRARCGGGKDVIYTYNCSLCDFTLHVECALKWRYIASDCHDHKFHILLISNESTECSVCGQNRMGPNNPPNYVCSICQLSAHKVCTSLQRRIKLSTHEHHLMLSWFLQYNIDRSIQFCRLCYTSMTKSRAAYYCQGCSYIVHPRCVTIWNKKKGHLEEENRDDPTHEDDSESKNPILGHHQTQNETNVDVFKHFGHDQHLLALSDHNHDQAVKDRQTTTCDGCMQPITITADAFYSCTEKEHCLFFLHKTCAQLPMETRHPFHTHRLRLLSRAPSIDGVFSCNVCRTFSQGFAYYCDICDFYLDLHCTTLPNSLSHEAHPHPLGFGRLMAYCYCNFCRGDTNDFSFNCWECSFKLCIPCLKLPLIARHKYDNHPLNLTNTTMLEIDPIGEYYCEICEGRLDYGARFYNCKICDFNCHPYCVLERCPRVKLGSTYKHNTHPHHVTFVEKRRSPIPFDKRNIILSCDLCHKNCEGLVFYCSQCNINLHREGQCPN